MTRDDEDEEHAQLPEHPSDYHWHGCSEMLFQDFDVLMSFDENLAGVEHPDHSINQYDEVGDLRAAAWIEPFGNVEPRDPDRGFRR